jgi:hypothetical protein
MAIDGKDVLVFRVSWHPERFDPGTVLTTPPGDGPTFVLFRIDAQSGETKPDPAFERLKRAMKERYPSDEVQYTWRRPFRSMGEPGSMRLVYVTGHNAARETCWSQIWRLGEGDEPDRLLLDDARTWPEPVFLDEETLVFASRKCNDPEAVSEWEIVRRTVSTQKELTLLRIPPAREVWITPSPSGQRLVVSSGLRWPEGNSPGQANSWLVTREGAVSEPLRTEFAFSSCFNPWSADESEMLEGFSLVDIRWDVVRPTCSIRQLINLKEHPEYRFAAFIMAFDEVACYAMTSDYLEPLNHQVWLCRIDLQTGKPEILLRFDGDRWVGCGGVTVKEAEVE